MPEADQPRSILEGGDSRKNSEAGQYANLRHDFSKAGLDRIGCADTTIRLCDDVITQALIDCTQQDHRRDTPPDASFSESKYHGLLLDIDAHDLDALTGRQTHIYYIYIIYYTLVYFRN